MEFRQNSSSGLTNAELEIFEELLYRNPNLLHQIRQPANFAVNNNVLQQKIDSQNRLPNNIGKVSNAPQYQNYNKDYLQQLKNYHSYYNPVTQKGRSENSHTNKH